MLQARRLQRAAWGTVVVAVAISSSPCHIVLLGSSSEAEDAVQETWLRLNRTDTSGVENLAGWLTASLDIISDPERLAGLHLAVLDPR
jgi:DNA-directed RNA polymerase specialized sigma24 family protein